MGRVSGLLTIAAIFLSACTNAMFETLKEETGKYDMLHNEPGTHTNLYLHDNQELRTEVGSSGTWWSKVAYLYPYDVSQSANSQSWSCVLSSDISGELYGYEFTVYSQSDAVIRIEAILNHRGEETLLFSAEESIVYGCDVAGVKLASYPNDPYYPNQPLIGINPLGGKGDTLILRLTHVFGSHNIEVYHDADDPGLCGYIILPLVK